MSLFNEKIKEINLKESLSLIIVLFLIQYLLNFLNVVHIDSVWIYVLVIFYFIYKLRNEIFLIKEDILEIKNWNIIKSVLFLVVLNIFFSYGMLYFADYVLMLFPSLNILNSHFTLNSYLTGGLIATIIISPISEELIFRGVFLNRLQLIVPVVFSILISSLLFASLHSFGSIFSAFIFGICVSILYLKSNNIFVPILFHFLNNLFAEIIVVCDPNKLLFTNDLVMMSMSILALISFILILIFVIKQLNTIRHNMF